MSEFSACFWSIASSIRSQPHHPLFPEPFSCWHSAGFRQVWLEGTRLCDQASAQVTVSRFLTAVHRSPALHGGAARPSVNQPPPPTPFLPPCWVTALTASRGRGETERVRSHLLFYRQPAFGPRDLIITRPVEWIAHEALSHTITQKHCTLWDKKKRRRMLLVHYRQVRPTCPPRRTYRSSPTNGHKKGQQMKPSEMKQWGVASDCPLALLLLPLD